MCVSCLPASGIPNVARTPPLLLVSVTLLLLIFSVCLSQVNCSYIPSSNKEDRKSVVRERGCLVV